MKEIITTICLCLLAILLLNPFHFWMPDMLLVIILAILFILFGIFTGFVLREKIIDERDSQHRTLAGRNAFISGAGIVIIGIAVQSYTHTLDPWLIIALVVMIVVKIATRLWSDKNL